MFIHRIDVEQVELHLANNLVPLGQISSKYAQLVHLAKRFMQCVGVAYQLNKLFACGGKGVQKFIQSATSRA
ncbi:Uncharacterised protein [Vibrio cholerae]|nr:Uncharacterised protein [Vibrio cholerae]CSA03080.1 Uncharacterised protein [Vibrio cholerae]CSA23032.1 Uncharacterised protein [Vibrio cholerae]CSA66092.1 Uncharacterised protein [Vibrio cholerae]CSA96111.1 Uncharacterised protein [Vibrio cholerae]